MHGKVHESTSLFPSELKDARGGYDKRCKKNPTFQLIIAGTAPKV